MLDAPMQTNLVATPATFRSIPVVARELRATPEALEGIYEAARLGLKGDSLALAAGMLPSEYRRLCQMDPIAELAEQKGRADAELAVSRTVYSAAEGGDAKAALSVLQHQYGWTARSEVSVDVYQRISITAALEAANARVVDVASSLDYNPPQRLNGLVVQDVEVAQ